MEYWFKQGKEIEAMECYNKSLFAPVYAETGNAFLKALLKYGYKTHAWDLYCDMLDQYGSDEIDYRHFDSRTVRIMVNECFDLGRCSQAIETYNKARAKNKFLSGSYIITRCCEIGMLSEAESLLADSVADGFGIIQETTFKTMIDAYVKAGRIDDAIKTSNKMIDLTLKDVSRLF